MVVAQLVQAALKRQYTRTMREAYAFARESAVAMAPECVLDCGSGTGHERWQTFGRDAPGAAQVRYVGLEWSQDDVDAGRASGLEILRADLNEPFPVPTASQDCVIAYSVLEHLMKPCGFIAECRRVLRPGGRFVVLTPNISTYFTALQVLLGRMPSSGPHPDSNALIESEHVRQVSEIERDDLESDTPQHRHLVVFSHRALKNFLDMAGFDVVAAKGFGYYPLPMLVQPLLERIDPYHCHQQVFVCSRRD